MLTTTKREYLHLKFLNFIVFLFLSGMLFSQTGGSSTYQFLDTPISARSAALGGRNISVINGDMNSVEDNPALADSSYVNNLSLSYVNYVSDINYGYIGYATAVKKWGIFNLGFQYLNYGKFIRADYTGQQLGEFSAADYSFNISYAKQFDSTLSIGVTVKNIFSDYESYESFGLAADLGAYYHANNGLFTAGLVLNNIGMQLVSYNGQKEKLPFRIDLGLSQKFKHAPIRVNVVLQQLQKWDLSYQIPVSAGGVKSKLVTADKFLRHVIVGAEIVPTNNFFINIAFDYNKLQQLKLSSRSGMSGFSFGAGFKISKFSLSYGRSTYNIGGASNHLTIMTNLNEFRNKVKIPNEKN